MATRAHRQNVDVVADHRITVVLPDDFPEGPAEVVVRPVPREPLPEVLVEKISTEGVRSEDEESARLAAAHEALARRFPPDPLLGPIVFHEDPTAPLTAEDWPDRDDE